MAGRRLERAKGFAEALNLLLWSADLLVRPSFRNLTDSYESWAYRNGLLRQVTTLERQQLLERDASAPDDRLYRLSAQRNGQTRIALCKRLLHMHMQPKLVMGAPPAIVGDQLVVTNDLSDPSGFYRLRRR